MVKSKKKNKKEVKRKKVNALENLSKTQEDIKAQMEKLAQQNVKPALKEAFKELEAAIPQLTAIKWQQYTPHFNDGDVCEFGLHGVGFQVDSHTEGGDFDDGFNEISSYTTITNGLTSEGLTKVQNDALVKFEGHLSNIEPMLQQAFSDGVEVTLTKGSIEVEEYSHD